MKYIISLFIIFSFFSYAGRDYKLSDHFDGKKFFNPRNHSLKSFWDLIKWKTTGKRIAWPESVENQKYDFPLFNKSDSKSVTTFINHATFLIQFKDLNILTDPVFSDRTSPFKFIGPKRVRRPGLTLSQLPPIDIVLISHNHYDHLDVDSLIEIDKKFAPIFLVPLGDKKLLESYGIKNVQEVDWWDEVDIKTYKVIFTPAYHWSARGLFDKCESLWGAYYIKSENYSVYFAGDTGYEDHFKETRLRLGPPDLSLLPIGAWSPRWFMKAYHMDPAEAVMAHHDLESKISIGMHFGTFQLTDEGYEDSQSLLRDITQKQGIEKEFFLLDQGESFIAQ